jgi:hypothetical protein
MSHRRLLKARYSGGSSYRSNYSKNTVTKTYYRKPIYKKVYIKKVYRKAGSYGSYKSINRPTIVVYGGQRTYTSAYSVANL